MYNNLKPITSGSFCYRYCMRKNNNKRIREVNFTH